MSTSAVKLDSKKILAEIIKCKSDFSYFCKNYVYILHPIRGLVPFELYQFQEKVVDALEGHRFVILKKFRQGGLSTTAAIYCLWKALFSTDMSILCISKTDREAVELMGIIRQAWAELPDWLRCNTIEDNKHVLWLETGSKIKCYTPKAGRSHSISLLVIDEAAFVPKMDDIWADVYPVVATGGKIVVISTVNRAGDWYHRYWMGAINGTNDFHPVVLSYKEHPDYNDPEWVESMRRQLGPAKFAREVEGEFTTSEKVWLPTIVLNDLKKQIKEPIRKALDDKLWIWEEPKDGTAYTLSCDCAEGLGGENDFSAFTIFNTASLEIVAEYYSNTVAPQDLALIIDSIGRYYNMATAVVAWDSTGPIVLDRLFNIIGYENVYFSTTGVKTLKLGLHTTRHTRPLMLEALYNCLTRNLVKCVSSRLYTELETFEYDPRKRRAEAAEGCHDDLVMALAGGLYARDNILKGLPIDEEIPANMKNTFDISGINQIDHEIRKDGIRIAGQDQSIEPVEIDMDNGSDRPRSPILDSFGW